MLIAMHSAERLHEVVEESVRSCVRYVRTFHAGVPWARAARRVIGGTGEDTARGGTMLNVELTEWDHVHVQA